jgi:diaminohydroxyphosphoribosylaminopyrimidine deaminase/5-amino-6-(5-phosphoribosylamino)uracil reductase
VVLDSQYKAPGSAKLFSLPGDILIYGVKPACEAGCSAVRGRAVQVSVPAISGRPALDAVMRDLATRGINEVLVEAGATLVGALIEAGLVDELVLYLAPHLMGSEARGLVDLVGLEHMADRIGLEWVDYRMVGQDLRLTARVAQAPKAV